MLLGQKTQSRIRLISWLISNSEIQDELKVAKTGEDRTNKSGFYLCADLNGIQVVYPVGERDPDEVREEILDKEGWRIIQIYTTKLRILEIFEREAETEIFFNEIYGRHPMEGIELYLSDLIKYSQLANETGIPADDEFKWELYCLGHTQRAAIFGVVDRKHVIRAFTISSANWEMISS